MIAVIQRVSRASVAVDSENVSEIGQGILILLGVSREDDREDCRLLADKISKLRIFKDDNGKMNLSVNDVQGSVIVVPNFTLLASYKKGNRPDYFQSAPPDTANELYEYFISYIKNYVSNVGTGVFGADMKVDICNDGPVTITMDSKVLRK